MSDHKQTYKTGNDRQGQFKWRNSRQISGVQGQLQAAISQCRDGAYITLDLTTAHNLMEVLRQAKHTEVGHGV